MRWRTRRKLYYTTVSMLPLIVIAGIIFYSVFFPTPTCSDGVQNGDETGVDCGGSCEQICQADTASTTTDWARSFPVSGDIYNAAALIKNPNVSLAAQSVPYRFRLYDEDGLLIVERRGQMDIPPQPKTLAFEPGVDTDGRQVDRTEFQWLESPFWKESPIARASFSISNKTLTGPTSSTPRLTFDITNRSVRDYERVAVSAIIRDGTDDPVHVSRTQIREIPAQESRSGVFTWRQPLPTRTVACSVPSDIMLLLDRSGSMNDDQANPPQPLTAVKKAAQNFVQRLGEQARSGLVSFAGSGRVDQRLTSTHTYTRQALNRLFIRPEDEQGVTNIGAAVRQARLQLTKGGTDKRTDVLVLLTDGKANAPRSPGGEVFARNQIERAKEVGIKIYTIGLGGSVNQRFLSQVASNDSHYYQVADRQALDQIYTQIHQRLCEQAPYVTEIIPTHYQLAE